jgi:hypothetical protein
MKTLSADQLTGTTRSQPNPATVTYLEQVTDDANFPTVNEKLERTIQPFVKAEAKRHERHKAASYLRGSRITRKRGGRARSNRVRTGQLPKTLYATTDGEGE